MLNARRSFRRAALFAALCVAVILAAAPLQPALIDLSGGALVPAARGETGHAATSALGTTAVTAAGQETALFSASYTTGEWTGTVLRTTLRLNTETGTAAPAGTPLWDAGALLAMTAPQDRNLWTFNPVTARAVPFSTPSFPEMDAALQAALNQSPRTGLPDGNGPGRVDYLRGGRALEGTAFRRRTGLMGDIINSGPVHVKAGADGTAMVYVGANAGFLHALRASDGQEVWAYMPRAVAASTPLLCEPDYVHRPYVDGVPAVATIQAGKQGRTVLASGMGGGAAGIFALDVTHPGTFGTGDGASVLFEFTAADDPVMGYVRAAPAIAKVMVGTAAGKPRYRWFAITGSGYNNHAIAPRNDQAVFFLALDKPAVDAWKEGENYFKVMLPAASAGEVNGTARPAVVQGDQGEARYVYIGDLQGRMWRLNLGKALTPAAIRSGQVLKTRADGTALPLFTATDEHGRAQPITAAAVIANAPAGGYMVVFGTGRLLEPRDLDGAAQQRIYSLWDGLGNRIADHGIVPADLKAVTATIAESGVTLTAGPFSIGDGEGQVKGCHFNLPSRGERVAADGSLGPRSVAIPSFIPHPGGGAPGGRLYLLDPFNCAALGGMSSTAGTPGPPHFIEDALNTQGGYSARPANGRRKYTTSETVYAPSHGGPGAGALSVRAKPSTVDAGRVSWREVHNFRSPP
jgi:type IV pilus assembly protein PilY1